MADRQIYIATAPKRTATRWSNKQTHWKKLVERCSQTAQTGESLAEYKAMSKPDQSQRKDVGGFVGGYLIEGQRRKGSVKFRDVLTLDIDYAKADTWEQYCLLYGNEAFVYGTHTYTPEAPRMRLVVLLSRSVTSDEYEAVGRALAAQIGIDLFDDTTYEAERLMYWPSSPRDVEYYFKHTEGEALDPDEVLATYHNWRDVSEWPYSSRVAACIHTSSKKQGDPTEKKGIVGAFCRCYNIHEAIATFLPDVYEQCGDTERYTYTQGSVAAGLVVYEGGLFAYSHNATDPCSQHLVNSFDLVRLHKFGKDDEHAQEGTSITSLPSYKKMSEFAASDAQVRLALMEERNASAEGDFKNVEAGTEEDTGWLKQMDYTRAGLVASTIKNIRLVLENDKRFKGKLWKNDFSGMDCYEGKMPWTVGRPLGIWTNSDDCCLRCFMEERYGITGKDRITDALTAVFNSRRKHPVREYLSGLHWDGTERLDTLLIDFLGARDTELTRAQTRKQFTAAVARATRPGCKYDYALVITGPEGLGKSTLLARMGGEWFSDSVVTVEGKEGMASLRKAWLIELGELAGIKRSEVEAVKQYLSRSVDKYRPAYGRREEEYPRQCVFFGTTNETNFLKGTDGNRRFWVVEAGVEEPTKTIWTELNSEYRDQVWAEAKTRYEQGEPLFLSRDLEMQARKMQKEFNDVAKDERIGLIQRYLDTPLPADWETRSLERRRAYFKQTDPLEAEGVLTRTEVSPVEILYELFGESLDEKLRYKSRGINALFEWIPDWEKGKTKRITGYGLQRMWVRSTQGEILTDDDL